MEVWDHISKPFKFRFQILKHTKLDGYFGVHQSLSIFLMNSKAQGHPKLHFEQSEQLSI